MRNVIFVLAVAFVIQEIFCDGDLLSKFHQHTYKVKDFRFQLIRYDKKFLNFLEIKAFKYNRTTTAHNVTVNSKVNFEHKLEAVVEVFKFLSNEYRPIAVRFQINFRKAYDANVAGMKDIKRCCNATNMEFYKETTYHICNFVIDETQFPPLAPNGQYKAELQYTYLNKEVALLHSFLEIYTPIYPKD